MTRGPLLRPEAVGQELVGLAAPPDWNTVFTTRGPLELEIGCGLGGHALEYVKRNPDVRYVAFEWRKKWAREVAHRAQEGGLAGLKVVEADARTEVPHLFAPESLSVIRLQFPDPWWKRAHHKRAILLPDFAALLRSRMKPGGVFDLRTDVEERAQEMLRTLESVGLHNPLGPGLFHPADPEEVPSSRERRYIENQEPVYRARLIRT